MIRILRDKRALDQVVGQLLVLMVSLSVLSLVMAVIVPVLGQYSSRNKIREAEAIMVSLENEIMKVQEEPAGSRRTLEVEIKDGGIDLMNGPPRMVFYVRVSKSVPMDISSMDFAYTGRGAMLRVNLTVPFLKQVFVGPGSNMVYITKMESGRINITIENFA